MSSAIWILGDSPLVEEYAGLCSGRGMNAHVLPPAPDIAGLPPEGKTPAAVFELTITSADRKRSNLKALARTLGTEIPILSSSVTVSVIEQSGWIGRGRIAGIGAFPTLLSQGRIELARNEDSDGMISRAAEIFDRLGIPTTLVGDTVGMVMPRILCGIINEACYALQEGIASKEDLDTAMKLGTNYPSGPLEWGARIGFRHVYAVLDALQRFYREERYRPSPLLQSLARQEPD